jgi:hypothetical protein
MGLFTGFEKGSGGRYTVNDDGIVVKISDHARLDWDITNGDVWFPKSGAGYYDKGMQKFFSSKQEKKDYMIANKLTQAGDYRKQPRTVDARGVGKTYYSYSGLNKCSDGYKHR